MGDSALSRLARAPDRADDRTPHLRRTRRALKVLTRGRPRAREAAAIAAAAWQRRQGARRRLADVQHKAVPVRSPGGDHPVAALRARIEALRADLVEMEDENAMLRAVADERREDFVHERDRADKLMVELLKAMSDLMSAMESAARLDGELAALKARPWWRRIAG